jgi:elongation factor Ts
MNNTDLIKELRALTQAGMKDCKDALEEAAWDLQKAVDIVKIKGLNVVSRTSNNVATEGIVRIGHVGDNRTKSMVEVNCQTDFVANSPDFNKFVDLVSFQLGSDVAQSNPFYHDCDVLENARKDLISKTKENIVIRRWWVEQVMPEAGRVCHYIHSNNKIGVLLSMVAPSVEAANTEDFKTLGEELAMQVAAMSSVAVSVDSLPAEVVERQRGIFEAQLKEMNKPQAAWAKILEGKFKKWHTEVCLLEQESVVQPKTSVQQVVKNMSAKLGGDIQVVGFIRCQVGA